MQMRMLNPWHREKTPNFNEQPLIKKIRSRQHHSHADWGFLPCSEPHERRGADLQRRHRRCLYRGLHLRQGRPPDQAGGTSQRALRSHHDRRLHRSHLDGGKQVQSKLKGHFSVQIIDDGPLSLSAMGIWATFGSFLLAAILHPQEFGCIFSIVIYLCSIPSM